MVISYLKWVDNKQIGAATFTPRHVCFSELLFCLSFRGYQMMMMICPERYDLNLNRSSRYLIRRGFEVLQLLVVQFFFPTGTQCCVHNYSLCDCCGLNYKEGEIE